MQFSGKIVAITGATSGIGEATAKAFSERGAQVCFCGRREGLGKTVEASIRNRGGIAHYICADVTIPDDMERFIKECLKLCGGLHIAFNNAGINHPPFKSAQMPDELLAKIMATNAGGVLNAMRAEISIFEELGGGIIINTASILASKGAAWMGVYGASKHAVIGLTKSAALEYADKNIRINSISPGPTDTPMYRKAMEEIQGDEEKYAGGFPKEGIAQPEDVAKAVMFLAQAENSFMTGANLVVDGGFSLK